MEVLMRVYHPSKNPKEAFILISMIVLIGILGQIFLHDFFMIFSLVFWIQYTAILTYLQFRKKKRRLNRTITELLLIPQLRFFLFIFIATLGILGVLKGMVFVGHATLIAWWLFGLNFYRHYRQFRRYE